MSLLGVTIAVSFGVNTRASLEIWLNGPLYCDDRVSTLNWYIALYAAIIGKA